jgi:hypothetical protein
MGDALAEMLEGGILTGFEGDVGAEDEVSDVDLEVGGSTPGSHLMTVGARPDCCCCGGAMMTKVDPADTLASSLVLNLLSRIESNSRSCSIVLDDMPAFGAEATAAEGAAEESAAVALLCSAD